MTGPVLIEAPAVAVSRRTPQLDCWVIVALWQGAWWKIFPDQWASAEAAHARAAKLPAGYSLPHLLHIRVPLGGHQ